MKKHTNRKELLSCSCIQRVNRREQKGRSMVEILGVLAIIGVLSSGGVLAYNFLMNKHKANGLMEKALDEALSISEKIRKKNSLKISHKNRFVFSSAEKVGLSHFKISLVPVDTSVCKQLKSMLDRTSLVYDISEDCSYMLFANILGEDSTIMSDLCAGKNCGHGFCSDSACICTDNYYGENCENAPLACQNGGSWNTTTHQCDCPNGYSGNTCGIKDPCLDVNCGTHGTCSDGACVCRDNYYGDRCQTAPLACQNGGTWDLIEHKCICPSGYEGETCGIKASYCSTNQCVVYKTKYTWSGARNKCGGIENMVSLSDLGCTTSKCTNFPSYLSEFSFWVSNCKGTTCDNSSTDDSGSAYYIYKGGSVYSYTRNYKSYYAVCKAIPDPCANVNCGAHGTCSDGSCVCDSGYSGTNCEIASNQKIYTCNGLGAHNVTDESGNIVGHCDGMNGCKNQGTPTPASNWLELCDVTVPEGYYYTSNGSVYYYDGQYIRDCIAFHEGDVGLTISSVCMPEAENSCANVNCGDHGTCQNGACVCDGGYYLNGGECTMCPVGTYAAAGANVCTPCPDGMTSDAGATSANDCKSEGVTCQNGGTWNASTGQCDCVYGYTGDDCSINGLCGASVTSQMIACPNDSCDYDLLKEYCYKKDAECDAKYICPTNYNQCVSENVFFCEGEVGGSNVNSAYSSSNGCTCRYSCYTGDTPIMLADGTCKRADEITYDDELLVWDFDNGCFAKSKPIWLQQPKIAQEYNYLRFSDGSELKTINQHRIFNKEAGKFTYPMTDETPIGTTTFNAKGEYVTLVEKRVLQEEVVYYNIITDYHLNCFTGNILTSCRLNNLYPIQDMKFVKDERELVPYSEYAELPRKWYDGLRLAEQPREINPGNAVRFGDKTVSDYVQRLIRMAQ